MDSFSFGHILSRKLYYEKFLSHYKQRGVKKWKTHKICQIILFTPMADAPLIPAVTELMLLSSFIQINENGQIVGGHYIKVLFWNSKNGKQKLSDRARKLKSGDLISCRVVFDAGIHSKAVGFEFKRSGLYTLAMKDEQKTYILHGHAEKVIHGKNGYCGIYVPIKRYQNGSFQTVWYLASFFNSNISVVKGDTVFLRGYRISDKSYNGFDYLDLTCSDIIGIHNL